MKKWFKTLATTCAIIPLAQCALIPGNSVAAEPAPQSAPAAPPAAPAEPVATTDADPALWVVKDEDTTIYLFGTVHVLKPGLSWFDEAVRQAFDKSDQLMLEMVLPENPKDIEDITKALTIDPEGKTLASRMTPEDHASYAAAVGALGLPVERFETFEPWYMGINLSILPLLKLGYNPAEGPEMVLTAAAKASSKPIAGLETVEQQFGFFDQLPEVQQVAFLNAVVKDIDTLEPMLNILIDQWSKGDPDALAATLNESMETTPELAQILLFQRNANWADQIKARMDQPGTVFVAVGAGHLAGQHSVQDYLKERGLTATRVDY